MRTHRDGRGALLYEAAIAHSLSPFSRPWGPAADPSRPQPGERGDAASILGTSPEIVEVRRHIEKIARADASVLIQGETGSGKELAARSIHQHSRRAAAPFVAVNCGAVPDGLIETEFFGHGKGAFTDAKEARPGVIAQAQSGTLFLDETDTLSPKAQVTLLRFLQDLRYRPVGTTREIWSDLRVIAASNQDLYALVEAGRFRRDLLYRLNIFELWIPPLRGRGDDIELIAQHFIRVFSNKYDVDIKPLHADALQWLRQHHWPGNVRELENWIHRELLLADGTDIRLRANRADQPDHAIAPSETADLRTAKARAVADVEASYVARALATAHGNVTAAARLAGKERRAFGRLLKKYGIDKRHYQS
jgi:DNA-binding NtrC family response regulator